jgi:hypothetical protein
MRLPSGPFASRHGAFVAAAVLALLMAGGTAWPQSGPQQPALGVQEPAQAQPATQSPPSDQPAPEAAPDNPGLVHEMGKLFDKIMPRSPSQTLDDFNSRAKDAAKSTGDALSRLARPGSMVSGRMICPVVAGGTPDCKAAADKLCQSKGYKEGKSLNGDAAETCSPKVMIPGRQRKPDDCRTDNYVTTALCQ